MRKSQEEECRAAFEQALPRIERHAKIQFRDVRCPAKKADLIAEAIGLSWKWWRRLVERGTDPTRFVSGIAGYAVKAARSGRLVAGSERKNDTMSPVAQRFHGFTVCSIPLFSTLSCNPLAEALTENTQTPVDEQVAFRVDFPAWLVTWDERRRRMIEQMARGERTLDLADHFGISPARVSQLRSEFFVSWMVFVE